MTISIIMNTQPVGGTFAVSPTTGLALNTSFLFDTKGWMDSVEDLPLYYTFSTYTSDSNNIQIIRGSDTVAYTTAILGQGLRNNGFAVFCSVAVTDRFGCSANAAYQVTVQAVANIGAMANAVTASMEAAFSSGSSEAVSQVVNAVAAAMNSVDCRGTEEICPGANRYPCGNTPRTCGPCVDGFIGVTGDSNTACISVKAKILNTGDRCNGLNETCIAGPCVNFRCVESQKTCKNNCSAPWVNVRLSTLI
jgi:hypothetical protein